MVNRISKSVCAFAVVWLWVIAVSSSAAIDTYEFADENTRQRFHQLTAELRCPKCQNQNLADSNAPIATDLRGEVYRLLTEGRTDKEIKRFLVDRYGEYVLYKPEWSRQTWLLWLAPAIFLLLALMILVMIIRRRARSAVREEQRDSLSEQEQQKLEALLKQERKKDS